MSETVTHDPVTNPDGTETLARRSEEDEAHAGELDADGGSDADADADADAEPEGAPLASGRQARANRILELLDRYIPAPEIPLAHEDAFQLLVAVILSAQCTDARVNMITPALFARAPDAHAMSKLRASQIRPIIRPCGLSAGKARAIAAISRYLVREHGGKVPHDIALLETLPAVGHKTASVVVAQAFGEPAFPVDTHIHRLAGRWQLSRARNVEEVEHDLKALFPRERWSTLHLQIIYFGRQYCPAKGHAPAECPICSWAMSKARALREERQGVSKPRMRPKKARTVEAAEAPTKRKAAKPAKPAAAKPVAAKRKPAAKR